MTEASCTDVLERRYRRLLACYPAAHRAVYDDEMIAVLMSAAAPGQRSPGLMETLSLVVSGLGARLRMPLRAADTPPWRDAIGAFGYVTAVMLAGMSAHRVVDSLVWRAQIGPSIGLPPTAIALSIVWMIVGVATGLGWRRTAAAAGTVGALGQVIALARLYVDDPGTVVTSWWRLVLAVAVAASLIALVRPTPHEQPTDQSSPLGVRSTLAVAAIAVLICVVPLAESGPVIGDLPITLVAAVVLLATPAAVALRLTPSIRRRVLLLASPAAATALLVAGTFGGFLASSPRFSPPVYLVAPQWIALVATPLVAFAIGAWMLARYERKLASGALLV